MERGLIFSQFARASKILIRHWEGKEGRGKKEREGREKERADLLLAHNQKAKLWINPWLSRILNIVMKSLMQPAMLRTRDCSCGKWRIQELTLGGAHGERAEREPINYTQSPQRGPGAELLVRGSWGEAPLKLKPLSFRTSSGSGKNALFSLLCNHSKLIIII